jgi:diguanylate cyclase (GGDEF)-like protein
MPSLRRAIANPGQLDSAPDDTLLSGRVRLLSRWVEVSADMLRLGREDEVRQLLAQYLQQELGARLVRFLPRGLIPAGDTSGTRAILLTMELSGEGVEIQLGEAKSPSASTHPNLNAGGWSTAERLLAEKAVEMTDACLASIERLREAQTQSMTDALTGLYNRRSLDRMLEREVLLASRHRTPLTVVVLDVDHFKQVNDDHGHAVGDELLKLMGSVLTSTLRRSDLAFRMGGDEFVVILPQTTLSSAMAAMEKVRRSLAESDVSHARLAGMVPTVSIGLAELWANATAMELLHAADEALYTAKRDNRDCIRTYRVAA